MPDHNAGNLPAVPPAVSLVPSAQVELEDFESFMLSMVESVGLPTDGILVQMKERRKLLRNVPDALDDLDAPQRGRSPYISKFMLAAAVGLFDAALNYLWDETISELRARVAGFDVAYFFDLAEPSPERRRDLKDPEDLAKIDDAKLMECANRIGLISDVGYRELDHIRYMRNHASAAHPNQVDLTGLQLAQWLEACIKQVITLPRDTTVAEIGALLRNVKTQRLSDADVTKTAGFFDRLSEDRSDNLADGFFGIYTRPDTEPHTLDNVRALWPKLWPFVSEDARSRTGTKLGRFHASAEKDRAARAHELLDLVEGGQYLPEPVRQAEIDRALDDLLEIHHAFNNFYNEPAAVRALKELVGTHGAVPAALARKYVHTVVYVFLTNGYGIATSADPIYRELINRFDVGQAATALRSYSDTAISSRLQQPLSQKKWNELIALIASKLTGRTDRALLAAVQAFKGTPDKLAKDSAIRKIRLPRVGASSGA